jgi:uncharacterized short protein YbdD (DUF466 family)
MRRIAEIASRAARTLRLIIGAPDYDRYLEHMRARHQNEKPLARAEFASQRLDDRYAKAGSRCC